VDSLGRNIALYKNFSDGTTTYTLGNEPASFTTTSTSLQIDLQEEHYVSFIIIYYTNPVPTGNTVSSKLSFNTTLNGATVSLFDALWRNQATRTLTGTGSRYNIGQPIMNKYDALGSLTANTIILQPTGTQGSIQSMQSSIFQIEATIYLICTTTVSRYLYYSGITYSGENIQTNTILTSITNTGTINTITRGIGTELLFAGSGVVTGFNIARYNSTITGISLPGDISGTISNIFWNGTKLYINIGSTIYLMNYSSMSLSSSFTIGLSPNLMVVDRTGNVYVSTTGGTKISTYSADGAVTAGYGTDTGGTLDGFTTIARFTSVTKMVIDSKDYIYVLDSNKVRIISPNGYVGTLIMASGITPPPPIISIGLDQNERLYLATSAKIYRYTITTTPNSGPFAGPYAATTGMYSMADSTVDGIQVYDKSLAGATYAEIIDLN
jgi:hypothetical protein